MTSKALRQRLAEYERRKEKNDLGRDLWDLIRSCRANPQLRAWITLESRFLCPLIVPGSEQEAFAVYLPLAVAKGSRIASPWGCITLSWPSGKVVALVDLRTSGCQEEIVLNESHLCGSDFAAAAQESMRSGSNLPQPPQPLADYLKRLMSNGCLAPIHGQATANGGSPCGLGKSGSPEVEEDVPQSARPSEPLSELLNQTRRLLDELQMQTLLREWRRIYASFNKTQFTVAVVGHFMRGKSTLINRLLGEDVLPVGVISGSGFLAEVVASERSTLALLRPDGEQRYSLTQETWSDLAPALQQGKRLLQGRIELPNPWLKEEGIRLIDTPSVEDLSEESAYAAVDKIATCDATLVAVSAAMAMSLTEKAFVEEHLLARKIPRVAVVLTRLDEVRESERGRVVDFVRRKIQPWGSQVALCAAHGEEVLNEESRAKLEAAGPEGIRGLISQWVASGEHRELVQTQVRLSLRRLLQLLQNSLTDQVEAAGQQQRQLSKRAKRRQRDVEEAGMSWGEIITELRLRERKAMQLLDAETSRQQEAVIERLTLSLETSQDPRKWWDTMLDHKLKQELEKGIQAVERPLSVQLARDAEWLDREMHEKFSVSSQAARSSAGLYALQHNKLSDASDLHDLSRVRLFTRLGAGAAAVAVYGVFGFLYGMTFGILSGVISDHYIKTRIGAQKKVLSQRLTKAMEESFRRANRGAFKRLKGFYAQLALELEGQEKVWRETQKELLQRSAGSKEQTDTVRLEQIHSEVDRILGALSM